MASSKWYRYRAQRISNAIRRPATLDGASGHGSQSLSVARRQTLSGVETGAATAAKHQASNVTTSLRPADVRPAFQDLLGASGRFTVAVELETSRGVTLGGRAKRVHEYARRLSESGLADAFTLTDNPGGHPHLRPETLGRSLLELGSELVINVSCKDYNRNGLESRLWSLASVGFHNILCLSGDYPSQGIGGGAKPVFDVDSAGLLEMVRRLNSGAGDATGLVSPALGTVFYPGAVVNPFKQREGEYMTQLFKLALKARVGARWFITQIGYDARKQDDLLRYMKANGLDQPVLGTVFLLGPQSARHFSTWAIPGVYLSPELLALAEKHAASPDKGRQFFNELAAKQVAVLRGLGYSGVHISGRPDFDRVRDVLEIEKSFGTSDWKQFAKDIQYAQPDEFYYFERDDTTGLSATEVNRNYARTRGRRAPLIRQAAMSPGYQIGRVAHAVMLSDKAPAAGAGRALLRATGKSKRLSKIGHLIEQAVKIPMYGCKDCGDCSLPELAYLCPESQCAKNQRNGPCGGTKAGRCEVLDKDCVWLRAYDRLKVTGQEENMLDAAPVLCDASLRGTSSWANALLGRDHTAKRLAGEGADVAPRP